MERFLGLALLLPLFGSSSALAADASSLGKIITRGSWKGCRLGSAPAADMRPVSPGAETYTRRGEALQFDGLSFSEISYWAQDGRITRFIFATADPTTARAIALMLKKEIRAEPLILEGTYFFEDVHLNIMLEKDEANGLVRVVFELK